MENDTGSYPASTSGFYMCVCPHVHMLEYIHTYTPYTNTRDEQTEFHLVFVFTKVEFPLEKINSNAWKKDRRVCIRAVWTDVWHDSPKSLLMKNN